MFKALPRDLQWEVLTEFAGTHVVRGGKLMRKIVFAKVHGKTVRKSTSGRESIELPVAELVRERKQLPRLHSGFLSTTKEQQEATRPKLLRIYSDSKVLQFFRDQYTDETVYLYRKEINNMILYEVRYNNSTEDAIVLSDYKRENYPSYPYTNKKRKIFT